MEDEIINRVAQSKLITIDLEEFYPPGLRSNVDISKWLYEGLVLREKEFRNAIAQYDWAVHSDSYIALSCSTDAIVPAWAYMLVTTKLAPYARRVVMGNTEQLETTLYQDVISKMDIEPYRDKPVIIKGCSNKPVPSNAYIMLTEKLQSVAKSIMYGEACSSVPLFKRK